MLGSVPTSHSVKTCDSLPFLTPAMFSGKRHPPPHGTLLGKELRALTADARSLNYSLSICFSALASSFSFLHPFLSPPPPARPSPPLFLPSFQTGSDHELSPPASLCRVEISTCQLLSTSSLLPSVTPEETPACEHSHFRLQSQPPGRPAPPDDLLPSEQLFIPPLLTLLLPAHFFSPL